MIGQFEILANWLQYWTGKNCFFWAKVSFGAYSAVCLWQIVTTKKVGWMDAWALLWGIRCTFYGLSSGRFFDDAYLAHMAEGKFGNPVKHQSLDRAIRMVGAFAASLAVVGSIMRGPIPLDFGLISLFCAVMFSACDPKPPCRGRLFEPITRLVPTRS